MRFQHSRLHRLLNKIDVSAGELACHPWIGARSGDRGNFYWGTTAGRRMHVNASRATYLLIVDPNIGDLVIRHTCDNGLCCNPRHLIPGTQIDNIRDKVERGRSRLGKLPHVCLTCRYCARQFDVIHSSRQRLFCSARCRDSFRTFAVNHALICVQASDELPGKRTRLPQPTAASECAR
jgi:hypothetical protein